MLIYNKNMLNISTNGFVYFFIYNNFLQNYTINLKIFFNYFTIHNVKKCQKPHTMCRVFTEFQKKCQKPQKKLKIFLKSC